MLICLSLLRLLITLPVTLVLFVLHLMSGLALQPQFDLLLGKFQYPAKYKLSYIFIIGFC